MTQDTKINENIRANQVRVIDEDGTQLGILNLREALNIAFSKNMDLIEVGATSNPPVCKIADWGKIQFQQKKKQKEAKAKQVVSEMKEIQLRPVTDKHDVEIKIKHATEFLNEGKKVRFLMKFKGREASHSEIGMKLMQDIASSFSGFILEKEPTQNGNNIMMVVSPDTKKMKSKQTKDLGETSNG